MTFRLGAIVGGEKWDELAKAVKEPSPEARTTGPRLCKRKVCHASEGAADAAGRSLVKRGRAAEGEMRSYKCDRCQMWHTTGEEKGGANGA